MYLLAVAVSVCIFCHRPLSLFHLSNLIHVFLDALLTELRASI